MTKFILADFDFGHGSERYVTYGKDRKFIGRFKYMRPAANARAFVKFLIANFTVEEYFAARDAGMSPLPILEAKGYESPNKKHAREAQARYERSKQPMRLIEVGAPL